MGVVPWRRCALIGPPRATITANARPTFITSK
jgi:hypothetical protein